ncbi:MAG: hypothetical protein JNM69_13600 [Archangium sp.]|nr:hypothetical protein [Archangium sp.]
MIPVRVESSSHDLDPASIRVSLGGEFGNVPIGCTGDGGIGDGGLADGGFCRIVPLSVSLGTFPGLRGSLELLATAADDVGNTALADAGLVQITRWGFSYQSSAGNGFALGFGGSLVIPSTGNSTLTILDSAGGLLSSRNLAMPPTNNVGIGQEAPQVVYVLESGTLSRGVTYMLKTEDQLSDWAVEERRDDLFPYPLVAESSVSALYSSSGKVKTSWASYQGTVATTGFAEILSFDGGIAGAAASGGQVHVTDGYSVFGFSGSTTSFNRLGGQMRIQTPPGFSSITHLIGSSTGFSGSGNSGGVNRHFDGSLFSSAPWGAGFTEVLGQPIKGQNNLYFIQMYGSWSTVCLTKQVTGSTNCVAGTISDNLVSIALGGSKTLFVSLVRGGVAFLQVRDSDTLVFRDEMRLPGATGACIGLTPTCIQGSPFVGCVDSTGRIVFVSTDASGVDTLADWPMQGHDPGRTYNHKTNLRPYACP